MKNSFVLYTEYKEHLEYLNQKQKGDLLDAIFQYAEKMTEESVTVELDDVTKMAFSFIKCQMQRDFEKYIEIREKRRIAGLKGGAPKGNKNASKQAKGCINNQNNQMLTKQAKQPVYVDVDVDVDVDDDVINKRAREEKISPMRKTYGDNNRVTLSSMERSKLVYEYGVDITKQAIAYLDKHKVSKGFMPSPDYSDYDAIKSWVIKAITAPVQPKKSTFNNFEQNSYTKEDFKKLEEQLLEN